jgi:hypothetical protein
MKCLLNASGCGPLAQISTPSGPTHGGPLTFSLNLVSRVPMVPNLVTRVCQLGQGRTLVRPWWKDLLRYAGCNQVSPLLYKSLVYLNLYSQSFDRR